MRWLDKIPKKTPVAETKRIDMLLKPEVLLVRLSELEKTITVHNKELSSLVGDVLPMINEYDNAFHVYRDTYGNAYGSLNICVFLVDSSIATKDKSGRQEALSKVATLLNLDGAHDKPAFEGETKNRAMERTINALKEAVQESEEIDNKGVALAHIEDLKLAFDGLNDLAADFKILAQQYQSSDKGAVR